MNHEEEKKLLNELILLRQEHEDLDKMIGNPEKLFKYDRVTIQRMKKRKLWLKDKISMLEATIYPDIIA